MLVVNKISPTILVVFGATGDLFRKKLAPALLNLFALGELPKSFLVVAFSRRTWDDDGFRKFLREVLGEKLENTQTDTREKFLASFCYIEGDLGNLESFKKVAGLLGRLDEEVNVCANKLFYLATPPTFYETILKNISESGLAIPCAPGKSGEETGWTRILIEKPFGSDLENARRIDLMLGKLFSENQIFRIDHYLAKETLKNILAFRFSDGAFKSLWSREHIEKVEIRLFEKEGIGSRGLFYDALGALRDVGQNHALQMLALIAMVEPEEFTETHIRHNRAQVFKNLELWPSDSGPFRAQYEGFCEEPGVASDSQTETYFKFQLALPTARWRGVPFIIEAGKSLPDSKGEIVVHFKKDHGALCPPEALCENGKTIIFRINSKGYPWKGTLGAYEKVLVDAILGDQTLFTSTDEVVAEWNIIMPILEAWQKVPLVKYAKGTMPEIS